MYVCKCACVCVCHNENSFFILCVHIVVFHRLSRKHMLNMFRCLVNYSTEHDVCVHMLRTCILCTHVTHATHVYSTIIIVNNQLLFYSVRTTHVGL